MQTLVHRSGLVHRTCLVTGASGALGAAVAEGLAREGAEVVLVGRDLARCEAVRQRVVAATGNERVHVELADLSRRADIKALVGRFMAEHARLDVLVHAAAVCAPTRQETPEGHELTWATNVLGAYQLTSRLTEVLRYCRPSRVLFVASGYAGGLELADPQFKTRTWHGWTAYTASQQAIRMLAWHMAEGLERSEVTINVVEPPAFRSHLFDLAPGSAALVARLHRRVAAHEVSLAAAAVVRAAAGPALSGVTNRLLRHDVEARCGFRHEVRQRALFNVCAKTTRVQPEFDSNIWREDDSMILDARALAEL